MRAKLPDIISGFCLSMAASIAFIASYLVLTPVLILTATSIIFLLTLIGTLGQLYEPDSSQGYKEGFQDGKETALRQIDQAESSSLISADLSTRNTEEKYKKEYVKGFNDGVEFVERAFEKEPENKEDVNMQQVSEEHSELHDRAEEETDVELETA